MTTTNWATKLVRSMPGLRRVRGWNRFAESLASHQGTFEAKMGGGVLCGDLSSFVDRQAYLFGGYERDLIDCFLSIMPPGGTALDVGANIGNHSVFFVQHFDRVIAFEPNPALLPRLRRTAQINLERFGKRIEVEPIGLGDEAGEFPFFSIDNGNEGLGTFSTAEQYDQPLRQIGSIRVAVGDQVVGNVDIAAIKIDVQGHEANVLRGMKHLLERNRPPVWLELGAATLGSDPTRAAIDTLFPYPIELLRFVTRRRKLISKTTLEPWPHAHIAEGDYVVRAVRK